MRALVAIWHREYLSFFCSPIAYVVGAIFLAWNGFSFWTLMMTLSDPSQPAAVGAVLREFFGGTLLHWVAVFSLVALLSMRSVAEERNTGMWESMLTTQVPPGIVVLGKWMALLCFYISLWVPTVFLVIVFSGFLPSEQSLDLGPVVAAYLGIVSIGAALTAVGIAISTATNHQVVAAIGSMAVFLGWLMLGEVGQFGTLSMSDSHWFFLIDLRAGLANFARGHVVLAVLVSLAGVVATALSLATAWASPSRDGRVRYGFAAFLLVISSAGASQLAGVHLASMDWTRARVNSLESNTKAVLNQVDGPVDVVVIRPADQVFDSVHGEVERLVDRLADYQPYLVRRDVDPLAQSEEIEKWAFQLAVREEDLTNGGAVIFQQHGRTRVVDFMAMAHYQFDDLGVGSLADFRAESAFRLALAEISMRRRESLCVSRGHGELVPTSKKGLASTEHWQGAAERVASEGIEIRELDELSLHTLQSCDALVLLGPSQALSLDELRGLEAYLEQGGNALIALRSRPVVAETIPRSSELSTTGIELIAAKRGMEVLKAVVVDPQASIDVSSEWITFDGYGDHPIVRDFDERRATIWHAPLALTPTSADVVPLVWGSSTAWSERSLEIMFASGRYERDSNDGDETTIALAHQAANGGRFLLFGGAESLSARWSERGVGGNERLLVSACFWVLHRDLELAAAGKQLEHLRLIMSRAQLKHAFFWLVLVGPTVFVLLGSLGWWWRRRE